VARRRRSDHREREVSDEVILGVLRQIQSIDERLTRVEQLLEDSELDRLAQAEQRDLIDLRMHSARLAAELSRVTVDLKARIDAVAAGPSPVADETLPAAAEHLPPPVERESTPAWEPLPDD